MRGAGDATEATQHPRPGDDRTTSDEPVVVPDPESPLVLVNEQHRLPPGWEPPDLVVPEAPFTFRGFHPKRQLREVAAQAFDELVAAGEDDGVLLVGVSGYRSEERQRDLFDARVRRDSEAAARQYLAAPGHSEHQTGLAIDVADRAGTCVIDLCFADTPEAAWLARHAHEHGFVIRYPAGKEAVTGINHEPWHLRYVGADVARALHESGHVLEEHLDGE